MSERILASSKKNIFLANLMILFVRGQWLRPNTLMSAKYLENDESINYIL
jgi:hypothetical protein